MERVAINPRVHGKEAARKRRSLEAYLADNLRNPEFRRHFEPRPVGRRRPIRE
jgi:hypothetical protein